MASRKTLNIGNLEALGTRRLAELLIELSTGDAGAKRRLRLELAGTEGSGEVAREVRKRLATIARSRSFVDWQNRRGLITDLETQRRAIVEHVAKADPGEGLELMWRFLGLAASVFERCGDSSRSIVAIFHRAVDDLAAIAGRAAIKPERLADDVFQALQEIDYGQYDELIPTLAPVLGKAGLGHLKQRITALSRTPVAKPPAASRRQIGWASSGPIYEDDIAETSRGIMVRHALRQIADATGDADGFAAQYDAKARKVPRVAAEIAERLLAGGRQEEALTVLDAAERPNKGWSSFEWEDARIATLEALGRPQEAREMRWTCFTAHLSAPHLRDYLKRLPDFEDIDAESRALDHAEAERSLLKALVFLVSWPALDRAARLAITRAKELDGDHYEYLTPAADALAGRHPLAATLLLRAMIDFALRQARSGRYKHAARHLMDCAGLAGSVGDFGRFETHDAYMERLRREHPRKSGFWALVSA